MKTAIGRVQEDVDSAGKDEEATPLKKKLDDFGDKLSILIGLICFLVWIMNFNKFYDPMHGTPIKGCIYYFKIAIALAVAAIPEGLPAVITTCLALGTRKMARNNCIVRRLPSVQTLGCTTVICSDKTGTLTKNEMCAVELAYVGESIKDMKTFKIEENSYDPNAKVVGLTKDHLKDRSPLLEMAYVCSINSTAKVVKDAGKFKRQGEPTEAALIVGSEKIGQVHSGTNFNSSPMPFHDQLTAKVEQIGVLEFSSERKTMSTVIKGLNLNSKGGNSVLLKGAPERVIEKCTTYKTQNGDVKAFDRVEKEQLIEFVKQMAGKGLRCLGTGIIYDGGNLADLTKENMNQKLANFELYNHFETGGTFLGIMCIKDPVRHEVKQAIQDCNTAGIRVIMITGDAKDTAVAIAKELNILDNDSDIKNDVWTGQEFSELTE
jgi:Ca2+-transporting ATPase